MGHPRYFGLRLDGGQVLRSSHYALLDDEVALTVEPAAPLGVVEAVYRESVELSTGDQYPVADLVLLRRDAR